MVGSPRCDEASVTKKGAWTAEEDSKLVAYVTRYGHWNWRQLPKFAGLARCGKSCRLRWLNYLKPGIKRGNYTQQEEETIIKLHRELGNSWSKIAAHLPGRTDNEIKNHCHAKLKKHLQVQQNPHNDSTLGKAKVFNPTEVQNQSPLESKQEIRDSVTNTASSSSQCKSSEVTSSQISNTFLVSSTDTGAYSGSDENLVVEDFYDDLAFLDTFIEPISENFWTEPYMVDNSDASVPFSTEPNQYFSPVWDEQLWGHNNQYSSPAWDEQLWGHNN